jgi:hypothetical protein
MFKNKQMIDQKTHPLQITVNYYSGIISAAAATMMNNKNNYYSIITPAHTHTHDCKSRQQLQSVFKRLEDALNCKSVSLKMLILTSDIQNKLLPRIKN